MKFFHSRQRRDEDLNAEIQAHLDEAIRDRIARGELPEEARANAFREFGNVGLVKEVTRAVWSYAWLEAIGQDIQFGLRMLRKNPGFSLIAILTLALGIGANVALFSLVKTVLLDPLPFAKPERLLQARLYSPATGEQDEWVSPRDVVDWRERSRSFDGIGIYRHSILDFAGEGTPEACYGVSLSHQLLPMLGVAPALGRFFTEDEDQPGRNRVIILSDDLWRRRFGARPDIVGQTIRANSGNYVVVGVMPSGFNFPLRLWVTLKLPSRQMGFWMPMGDDARAGNRQSTNCNAILRLKPGATIVQAQAELDAISSQLAQEAPQSNAGRGVRLVTLKEQTVGKERAVLLALFCAVGLVVLIVCANIAGLSLVRSEARRKEIAVRFALGANRWRLAGQLMTESLLLAFLGGTGGMALAAGSLKLLIRLSPHHIPRLAEARIDITTMAFALTMTAIAGMLFGALPAWRAARINLAAILQRFSIGYAVQVKFQHKGSRAQRFKEPFVDRPLNL